MFNNISEKDLATLFNQLSSFYKAGLPFLSVFDSLINTCNNNALKELLIKTRKSISSGKTLYNSMFNAGFAKHLQLWELNFIQIGESSGDLDQVFIDLAKVHESNLSFRRSIIAALIYPVILFHLGAIILPLALLFQGAQGEYFLNVFIMLAVFWGTVSAFILIKKIFDLIGKGIVLDTFFFRIPFMKSFAISRFFKSFSLLINTNLTVNDKLQWSASSSGNKYIETRIKKQLSRTKDFNSGITDFLISTNLFSYDIQAFCRTGEESGELEKMTAHLSKQYEEQGRHQFRVFSIVLPVVIYLICAGFIGYRIIRAFLNYFNAIQF